MKSKPLPFFILMILVLLTILIMNTGYPVQAQQSESLDPLAPVKTKTRTPGRKFTRKPSRTPTATRNAATLTAIASQTRGVSTSTSIAQPTDTATGKPSTLTLTANPSSTVTGTPPTPTLTLSPTKTVTGTPPTPTFTVRPSNTVTGTPPTSTITATIYIPTDASTLTLTAIFSHVASTSTPYKFLTATSGPGDIYVTPGTSEPSIILEWLSKPTTDVELHALSSDDIKLMVTCVVFLVVLAIFIYMLEKFIRTRNRN